MQSSSAEVTMMESQNRKRAPAWTEREVRDLIAVWGEESVLSELRSSFRNAKTFVKISQGMKDRGHNRDPKQCRVKLKELRQAYQKTREANGRSGSEPQTCRFYDELHAILGGSATTTPAVLFDSFNGDGGNTEAGFGDEEDDDEEEVVDSSQQASGETGFPDSQELFLTLDLEPVPPEPTQGCLLDPAGGEGTSAACVSMITGSSPSQRLVKIRKKKKRTRDEMFSELMLSSHTDRAQTNAWRQIMSDCRKAQNDQEERWRAEESKWRAEESEWRAEERAEARMWRQRDERRESDEVDKWRDWCLNFLYILQNVLQGNETPANKPRLEHQRKFAVKQTMAKKNTTIFYTNKAKRYGSDSDTGPDSQRYLDTYLPWKEKAEVGSGVDDCIERLRKKAIESSSCNQNHERFQYLNDGIIRHQSTNCKQSGSKDGFISGNGKTDIL
ncbi:uncharacterized protein LOC141980898 [Natator depressus]|uniref:uncharacterized protein LOC141980898 n=2 Tax=Natator depressus TaxID=27790 RepID=UPI003EBFBBC0